jgi:hypothetical protein
VRQEHTLLEDGLPAGHAQCETRVNGSGLALAFEGAIGAPRPDRIVAGEARIDAEGRWARMHLELDGQTLPFDVPPEALLDIQGAPALVGATAQRLIRGGMKPGRSDRSVRRLKGRCLWLGGRDWRLLLPLESTGFSVRANGTVAGVEEAALLVE